VPGAQVHRIDPALVQAHSGLDRVADDAFATSQKLPSENRLYCSTFEGEELHAEIPAWYCAPGAPIPD